MDELGGPCPWRGVVVGGENGLLDHAPSGGELVFDRPVPIEIDGEPMRADRVKIQALSRPLLLRVPHGQGAS